MANFFKKKKKKKEKKEETFGTDVFCLQGSLRNAS